MERKLIKNFMQQPMSAEILFRLFLKFLKMLI